MSRQRWGAFLVAVLVFVALMLAVVLPLVRSVRDTLGAAQSATRTAQQTATAMQAMAASIERLQAAVDPDSDAAKRVAATDAQKAWCKDWQKGYRPWNPEADGTGWFLDLPTGQGKHYATEGQARAEAQRLAEQYKEAGC